MGGTYSAGGALPGAGGGTSPGGDTGAGGADGVGGAPGAGGARINYCGKVFKDCNATTDDGCETNVQTDPAHCGDCETTCSGAPNAVPGCFVGECDYACTIGFGDCDGQAENGCEVNLLSDAQNCGSCRHDCGENACQNGGCQCAGTSVTAEETPLNIYVVFDQSGSMDQGVTGGTKWNVIKDALTAFVQNPAAAGIGLGIGYFPVVLPDAPGACTIDADCGRYGPCVGGIIVGTSHLWGACALADACQAGTYTADVPIGQLPGIGGNIVTSLGAHGPGGGTPTYPALEGAYAYAKQYAAAHPDEKTIVVLATDGDPSGCDPSRNNVNGISTNLVRPARTTNPPILTFVVGVGASLTSLNQIAVEGGTQQAFIVDAAGADPGGQFLSAMLAIKSSVLLGCQYGIPTPPGGGAPDFTKVNVQYTPPNGSATVLRGVPNPASCDAGGGWYYDNPTSPSQIVLCEASCRSVNAGAGSTVQVLLGCGTNG